MESLSKSEIAEIVRLQRDAGVERLSRHFSWDEFADPRCRLHQEFVYDVAAFAAHRGFSRDHVIRAAGAAKSIFPRLHDLDAHQLMSLFKDVLPPLTPFQRVQFTEYLVDTLVARRRLFSAVAGRARDVSIVRLDLVVQSPPTPCPLEQGTDLREWEAQQAEARSASAQETQEELSDGPRVSLEDVGVPDKDGKESVRAAAKSTEGQRADNLDQEANQLTDSQALGQQKAAAATRGRHGTKPHSTTPVKAKQRTAKTRKQ